MKIKLLPIIFLTFITFNVFSQVGVGTTAPEGALDVKSTTNGFLPPRVSLTSIIVAAPVVNPQGLPLAAGTIVWNTATAGTIPNNVVPGLYYWNGSRWIAFAGSPGGLDWSLKGNGGTNAGTDFLGTIDLQDLVLKANNVERIRMGNNETTINDNALNYDFRVESQVEPEMFFVDADKSHVHVRAASPFPTIDMFTAVGQTNDYAINGYSTGQSCTAVYGRHSTTATGTNMNAGAAFDGTGSGFSTQPGWNVGVVGSGNQAGIMGSSNDGTSDRQGGYFTISETGTTQSIASVAGFTTSGNDYYGGFFDGNQSTGDYAWIGIRIGGTNYGILSSGTKSTMIKDEDNKNRVMYCTEAPEILFQDFGEGQLVNGVATIDFDRLVTRSLSDKKPVKVFVQLEGDCNGVYIYDKSNKGFKVKELNRGTSNIKFSWQVVGNRADETDANGNVTTEYDNVRFPIGPEKLKYENSKNSKVGK